MTQMATKPPTQGRVSWISWLAGPGGHTSQDAWALLCGHGFLIPDMQGKLIALCSLSLSP